MTGNSVPDLFIHCNESLLTDVKLSYMYTV